MAEEQFQITIVYSTSAVDEIDSIWEWNVGHNGFEQAVAYRRFLIGEIESLKENPNRGVVVNNNLSLRFLLMKWSPNGHGHVAVYRFDETRSEITVAHIFHTRQDWRSKLN